MQGLGLVTYLMENSGIAPAALKEHLGVSERTMRNRITDANAMLGDTARIQFDRRAGGYVIHVNDREGLVARLRHADDLDPLDRLPSTHEQRVAYLLQDLLMRSDWITLDDLSSLLFVSRSTCSASLKGVREQLARFNLELESRPRYGLKVQGSEMNRRLCLASMAVENLVGEDTRVGTDPRRLKKIASCVDRALDAQDFKINPVTHQNLLVHISVALVRMSQGAYVPMDLDNMEKIVSTHEFEVACTMADQLNAAFDVELPREEVAYIAIHLAGKRSGEDSASEDALVINDEAWRIAADMIDVVYRAFRFDFRDDVELRMNLARHIMPLSVRLRYHMQMDNPMLADIRERLPLAYSMAVDACLVLQERYGVAVGDDEMGFIALAFALANERKKTDAPKKNVLVVCASGAGSARLLAYRVQNEFGNYIGSVSTCDASEFATRDLACIDYVFTTVPLERQVSIPVLQISMFLDNADRTSAETALSAELPVRLGDYFKPELFAGNLRVATPAQAIERLCELARAQVELPANFEQLVDQREAMAPTSFGNLVALPHPAEAVSSKTFAVVGVLSQPVEWGDRPVQVVILVSAAVGAGDGINDFYRATSRLLTSEESIQRLISNRTFECLLEELKGRN